MTFASEFGQDRIAFEALGCKRSGRFIDIGATDGVTRNNSLALEREYAWQGVCIEPVSAFYEKLRCNRSCYTIHACVGSHSQAGLVPFFDDPGNQEVSHITQRGPLLVPCLTLNQVLAGAGWTEIDFLSIDTEGNEFNILSAIDFKRVTIGVITFEHNAHWGKVQQNHKAAIEALLTMQGYSHLADAGVDSLYIRR